MISLTDSGPGTLKNPIDVDASLFVARQTTPGAEFQLQSSSDQTSLVVKNVVVASFYGF
jgi:hypothetical protein